MLKAGKGNSLAKRHSFANTTNKIRQSKAKQNKNWNIKTTARSKLKRNGSSYDAASRRKQAPHLPSKHHPLLSATVSYYSLFDPLTFESRGLRNCLSKSRTNDDRALRGFLSRCVHFAVARSFPRACLARKTLVVKIVCSFKHAVHSSWWKWGHSAALGSHELFIADGIIYIW